MRRCRRIDAHVMQPTPRSTPSHWHGVVVQGL
jgi:hypothetical protein